MNSLKQALATSGFRWLLQFLLLLTVMALLPWEPQGPFDARDYQRIEGVTLSYPWWGVLFEPLFAPGHMLIGAPDFRQAIIAGAAWVFALSVLFVLWQRWRQQPRRPLYTAWRLLLVPTISLSLYLAYVIASAVLYFPSWNLEVDNPDWVVADLQSHTLGSHDGMVTARKSLDWHSDRGYDLFAVTEHVDPSGAFATRELARRTEGAPVVIPGVEVNSEHEDFLLGIGLKNNEILQYRDHREDYARRFIADIHDRHNGAAIALSWGVAPERVAQLAEAGIDAFELVNTGHPDVSLALRKELLRAEKEYGVVMLASTDWHGWGGFSRTWTLINIPGASQLNDEQLAERTVTLLRERRQEAFIPVASGYMGPVPLLRPLLTPFAEAARYGAELSVPRLASWWGWFLILIALHRWLGKRRFASGKTLLSLTTLGLGSALLLRASELYGLWPQIPATDYTLEMGQHVLYLGLITLVVGIVEGVTVLWLRKRSAVTGETEMEANPSSEQSADSG